MGKHGKVRTYGGMIMAKSSNASLNRAISAKNDEFYTQRKDIEDELKHYKEQFLGKVVYCNCDDPYESSFFKFFAAKFEDWELRKLITTSYAGSPITDVEPCRLEIVTVAGLASRGVIDHDDLVWLIEHNEGAATRLQGDGDFRSEECMESLAEADIVCTNPPFSLFREYVAQLVEYGKKFLILGSLNAITYKEIFKLIMTDKLWVGYNNGAKTYRVPDSYEQNNTFVGVDGKRYATMGNTGWYTNLDVLKRHERLTLYKQYTPKEFPKYDNYDAINVNKVADIPQDYDGVMGVPITFLDKYNPEQFEIVGSNRGVDQDPNGVYGRGSHLNGRETFKRLFIKHR